MTIDISLIQKLRERTGAGMADVKEALEVSGGDENAAIDWLRKKGAKAAAKRADRVTTEGLVHAYIHANGKIGAIIAIGCETDFVARNEQFKAFANDLCMQIVAMSPLYVKSDQIPVADIEKRRAEYVVELKEGGKPENMIEKIVEGKLAKWYEEVCLLNQKYIKNDEITVQEYINEKVGSIGEKIEVISFKKLEI